MDLAVNGDRLYAWQELLPDGWGTIAVGDVNIIAGTTSVIPLVGRDLKTVRAFRKWAELHQSKAHNPIRLARFELAQEMERS